MCPPEYFEWDRPGFLKRFMPRTPICESAFSRIQILSHINFSAKPAWKDNTKRKISDTE